jgi:hypothetical protein
MARRPKIDQRAIEKHVKGIVKGYERAARRNPIRVPIRTDVSPEGVSVVGRHTIEANPILSRLLMWLDGQAQLHPSLYVDVTRFVEEQQLAGEDPSVLAFELEERGLVEIMRTMGGAPDVHLTDAGRVAVHRLKKLQQDRTARLRYTIDAALRWLFDTAGDQTPVDPTLFLSTAGSSFAGADVSGAELHQALAYLEEHEFIERVDTEPAPVAITPQGITCVLSGGSVHDHTNQPRAGATYNNFLPNAQGVIIGEQQNVTQNNTAGIDPTAFVQLAGYVGQISGTLGLADPDRAELERVAQELHNEAMSSNPEPGRMRQFATQVKEKLMEAGSTMAATVGVQMAEQALGSLM